MTTLDVTQDPSVRYCIPLWQRDAQIREAIARSLPRVQPWTGPVRSEPIAVVGYGPSLQDTWHELRTFRYVISCSGAHGFLVERGIVPTWHVEVDPRPHKVRLIGPPDRRVTYLLASTCHRDVFTHLQDMPVEVWHVFDASETGLQLLPSEEWAFTGGCDAGLRSLTLAAVLGFRDLQVYGLDGCGRASSHAGAHPHTVKTYQPCEYDGVTYQTTPALLAAARQVWHELDQMPAVRATFHGTGLIQHMAQHYVPKPAAQANIVAYAKPPLLSATYQALNQQLHAENAAYGVGGHQHAATVQKLVAKSPALRSVLDYGCGKGQLAHALPFPIWEYDPAIPGKMTSPRPADLVVCTDVLEHVEPDFLDAVLADLRRCVRRIGYFVIHTGAAAKTLPDGRNTHLIQQGRAWWEARLRTVFPTVAIREQGPLLLVLVS